ncbi:MAG: histidine phosphatase family protein [Bacteroidales bacterium]|nr:histidine phosphatase family protein [Bacteroidales bacterium]
MKVLHVVRHAKSSWDYNGTADIDRTLKAKGIRNAYEMSRRLKLSQQVPQKIITSPANRALHTAVIFARVLGYPLSELEISNVLYESSVEKMLDMIKKSDDNLQSVMICGHNPDFTDLVNHFLKAPVSNIPTAGSVTLAFNASSWKEIDRKNLDKHLFNFPEKDE